MKKLENMLRSAVFAGSMALAGLGLYSTAVAGEPGPKSDATVVDARGPDAGAPKLKYKLDAGVPDTASPDSAKPDMYGGKKDKGAPIVKKDMSWNWNFSDSGSNAEATPDASVRKDMGTKKDLGSQKDMGTKDMGPKKDVGSDKGKGKTAPKTPPKKVPKKTPKVEYKGKLEIKCEKGEYKVPTNRGDLPGKCVIDNKPKYKPSKLGTKTICGTDVVKKVKFKTGKKATFKELNLKGYTCMHKHVVKSFGFDFLNGNQYTNKLEEMCGPQYQCAKNGLAQKAKGLSKAKQLENMLEPCKDEYKVLKTKTEAAQKSYTGLQAAIRNLDGAVAKQKAQVKANYPKALEAVKKGVPQVGDSEAVNKAKAFFDASKKDYQAKEKDLKAYLGELAKTGCVTEDLGHLNKKIQNQFTQVYNDLNDLGGEVDANTEGRLANKKKLGELGPKVRKNITNIGNNADNIGVNSDDIEGLKKKDLQHDAAIKKGTAARKALEEKVSKGHGVEVGIGPVYMKDAANAETGDNGSRYGVMAQVVKKFGHKAKTYLGGFLMVTGGSGSKTTDANKPSYQGTVTNESGNTSFTAGVVAGKDDLLHNGKNVDFGLEGALGGGVDLETKNTKVKGQHYVNGVKQGKALEYDKDSTTERPGNFVGMICPTVTFNNKLKLSTCAIGKLNTKGKVSPGGSLLLKYAF